jgi:predicted phage terminase large subunit-like protein
MGLALRRDDAAADFAATRLGRLVLLRPEAVRAEACRRSLFAFLQEFWDLIIDETPIWNWHIPFICGELEDLFWGVLARRRKQYDLLINIPPGTTKTTIVSVAFPAWAWVARAPAGFCPPVERAAALRAPEGADPRPSGANMRFITGSYAQDISLKASGLSRDIVRSERYRRYFPEVTLRQDQEAKSDYANTLKGSRFSTSTNSRAYGTHAHIIIIDDPIDPDQATSELESLRANEFIDNVRTRTVDKRVTPMILVQQRLGENDPSAHLKKTARAVRHLRLPATDDYLVEPPELRARYDDACGMLDPVRMDGQVLADHRRILGAYKYGGQFGQDPKPREGGMFQKQWFEVVDAAPSRGWTNAPIIEVRGWDLAASKKKRGSAGAKQAATAGIKIRLVDARVVNGGLAGGTVYVLDDVNLHGTGGQVRTAMRATASQDGPECTQDIPQDPGQAGKDQIRSLVANLHGFKVAFSTESGDKVVRAEPLSAQVEAGNVKVVKGEWNRDFFEELGIYPNGRMDRVDALTRAYSRALKLAARGGRTVGGPDGVGATRNMDPEGAS